MDRAARGPRARRRVPPRRGRRRPRRRGRPARRPGRRRHGRPRRPPRRRPRARRSAAARVRGPPRLPPLRPARAEGRCRRPVHPPRRAHQARADPRHLRSPAGPQPGHRPALGRPGDRVLAENPTYPNALDALRQAGLRTGPVPVSDDGWDLEAAESALRGTAPRLAYTIPDFHNPTGALMPPEQRLRLIAATRAAGAWLVVDETVADIALDVPAPAPTASLGARGAADHVITIGSLSKTHWGGIRVGWVRAAEKVVNELATVRVAADMTGSVLDQLVALAFLDGADGALPERLAQLRSRRAALVRCLERHAPQWSWRVPPGGLSLWIDLGEPVASALAERAAGTGVYVSRGARFGVDPGTFAHRLRIPYTLPEDRLEEGVRRLAAAFHDGVPLTPSIERPHWVA
ncbi:aminotransferase-like domain-containing protein [Streptomyces sp. CS62]|uniref:aminotransferase-like domain-containing protein n=1 Tax=Streptomyces sp. CS62 TaxID=3119268 RepID=UPI002F936A29